MKFSDFEAAFVRENRILKGLLSVALILSGLSTTLVLMGKSYVIYKNGAIFHERLLAEDVCREGFLSVVSGDPSKTLITSDLLSILARDSMLFPTMTLLKVESLERGACKVIMKSEEALHAFKLGLIEGNALPFYYQIQQIDEIKVEEKEQ
ncbi:MAG: hypothetical protein A2X86_19790 [Bdellovibrionales bacterium GWA2_49_15]|nr:MAG: hypothetical protein A2X86_19790 [Bdellovibrionales bacterium GWA2_49_15]HAZ12502.1 hypothetical protein [Bdellovibrionales bacterium]